MSERTQEETGSRQVTIVVESAASPAALFRLLVDGPSWVAWSPLDECVSEGLGPDGEERVGTVRHNRRGRTRGEDRITELVPDRTFRYEHVKGLPVRSYEAVVTLVPNHEGGSTVTWHARFQPRWPGTTGLLRRGIERFLTGCAHGLADSTE